MRPRFQTIWAEFMRGFKEAHLPEPAKAAGFVIGGAIGIGLVAAAFA